MSKKLIKKANSAKELLILVFLEFIKEADKKNVTLAKYCKVKGIELSKDLFRLLNSPIAKLSYSQIKYIEILIADDANQILMLKHNKKEVFDG